MHGHVLNASASPVALKAAWVMIAPSLVPNLLLLETTQSLMVSTFGRVFFHPSPQVLQWTMVPSLSPSSSSILALTASWDSLLSLSALDLGISIVSCNLAQLGRHLGQAIYCEVLSSVSHRHGSTDYVKEPQLFTKL